MNGNISFTLLITWLARHWIQSVSAHVREWYPSKAIRLHIRSLPRTWPSYGREGRALTFCPSCCLCIAVELLP